VDFKRLGTILIIGGSAVTVAAFAWWLAFYSTIVNELSRAPNAPRTTSVFDLASCLYSSRDVCGFIAGFARLLGKTPYEPMLLWLGLGVLVAGVVIRLAAKPSVGRS
jgi:hypothetical protein